MEKNEEQDSVNYRPEYLLALLKVNMEKQLQLIKQLEENGDK